jgi:CRISPR-associated protein Csa3
MDVKWVMSLKRAIIASFGFDVDFVLRRLASSRYDRVVLLSLKTPDGFERVKKAYSTLSIICNSLKIECILEPISPSLLLKSVYSILLHETRSNDEVELYLTGGPRMLIAALLISATMLPVTEARKTRVIVEGEGFECTLTVELSILLEILRLDERDKSIVKTLESEEQTLAEVSRKTGLPKATLYRRLGELIAKGVVLKTNTEAYKARQLAEINCIE